MTAVERLAKAIEYPDTVTGTTATLTIDDGSVRLSEANGRIRFERTLCRPEEGEEETLAKFAGYAAGRLLKEEAVLAWDPGAEALILWQEAPVTLSDAALQRVFDLFLVSCDWWLARVNSEGTAPTRFPEMMIIP